MPRRRAGSPPGSPNPTRRRRSVTPISNPDPAPAMETEISLLQDRGQTSRFHVTSPEAIALTPAAVSRAAPVTLVSNSRGLFDETELSDEELQHLVVPSPQEAVLQPPPIPARDTIVPRRVDEDGKEPAEALKQICGICLSEEQGGILQGLLNCCSHFFCFTCILEWSKMESRCPVCKRRFNTITVADVGSGLTSTAIRVEKRNQVYQLTEEERRRWIDPSENLSPIETLDEHRRAESHFSVEPVSTSTGRQPTLDRRRVMDRRIRMLLFRGRAATNARQYAVENFLGIANAKEQLIPTVKRSIGRICAQPPLDESAFLNVARRATNTILASAGIAHNSDRVVATPFHFPRDCRHACDGREPAFLMSSVCSPCFESFVGDVVGHIVNMFS